MSPSHINSDPAPDPQATPSEAEPGEPGEPGDLGGEEHGPGRRGRASTWLVALAVAVALLGLGVLTTQPGEIDPAGELAEPLPVTVIEARLESGYETRRSYVGRLEASRSSQLGFELGGLLTRVRVDEGDLVSEGELVAKLDTERLEARRRSLEAQLQQAEADVTLAELTRRRVGEAQELDAVSPQRLDEAELGLEARRAAAEQARSALAEIDVELEKSRLLAPYDAVIADRLVDEGQVVDAGTPVLAVLERGKPEARIGVAGEAVSSLELGQQHTVTVGERIWNATVLAVLPVRRAGTRSVEVLLELDAEIITDRLFDGDLARLELAQRTETPGYWLPSSALTESSRGLWAVYVVPGGDGQGAVERRELEVLHQEADRVFARGTLQDGERVVSGGLHRLVPGQPVVVHERDGGAR